MAKRIPRGELFRKFNEWGFDAKGWSPRTRAQYYRTAMRADEWLTENGRRGLLWADRRDLETFLFRLPPTARTRNQIRQGLIAFGNFLVDKEMRTDNPASGLPRLPEPALIPKALERAAARRIVSAAKFFGPMVHVLILVFAYEGMRAAEARHLEWSALAQDGWVRFMAKGRGGRSKERVIPIHPALRSALAAWRAECSDARWIFPSPQRWNRPYSSVALGNFVRAVGDVAGVKGLHPHQLRHTFATELYEETGDALVVKEALGHANLGTTQIYTKVRPARLEEAMRKLNFGEAEGG